MDIWIRIYTSLQNLWMKTTLSELIPRRGIVVAHSSEVVSSCFACDVAMCTVHRNRRIMQPFSVNSEKYAVIPIESANTCPGVEAEEAKFRNQIAPGDIRSPEELLEVQKFIHFLHALGLPRVAEEYLAIFSSTVSNYALPEQLAIEPTPISSASIQPAEKTPAQLRTPDEGREIGRMSEERLLSLLENKDLFPWIYKVIVEPPNNARNDFILILHREHPITRILGCAKIFVDCKSSTERVRKYYEKNTRRQSVGAHQTLVRDRKFWAINAYEDLSDQAIFAQVVSYILVTTSKFNQPLHWESVLSHLTPEVVAGFNAETDMVLEYGKIIMQDLLRPEVELYLQKVAATFALGLIMELPVREEVPVR